MLHVTYKRNDILQSSTHWISPFLLTQTIHIILHLKVSHYCLAFPIQHLLHINRDCYLYEGLFNLRGNRSDCVKLRDKIVSAAESMNLKEKLIIYQTSCCPRPVWLSSVEHTFFFFNSITMERLKLSSFKKNTKASRKSSIQLMQYVYIISSHTIALCKE